MARMIRCGMPGLSHTADGIGCFALSVTLPEARPETVKSPLQICKVHRRAAVEQSLDTAGVDFHSVSSTRCHPQLLQCHIQGKLACFSATVLTGVLQIMAGWMRLGTLMRFVSRSVVTGFVNALAILIFMAQLPELTNVTWHVYAMTAAGLAIIYGFPYITKTIPSPLVTIVVLTAVAIFIDLDSRTVGDMGALPDSLPVFLIPDIPFNLDTLAIIFPFSLTLMVVGLLESLMTATIVDDGGVVTRRGVELVAGSPLFRGLPVHLLMSGKESAEAPRQLEWARKVLEAAGFDAPTSLIPGDAERVIAKSVQDENIDLLIMGAYSHSPLRSLFLGSKTSDLLRSANIPTLLLR